MNYAISPALSRAARGLLNWSRDKLAEAAGVPSRTVADFELGNTTPRASTTERLVAALEAAGVEITNGDAPGVRLRAILLPLDQSEADPITPTTVEEVR